jgi:hypothetical protein
MLRSSEAYDLLMTLAYSGKGTVQVGGQPCNVTMYRSDISYQTSGERIRITGTRPNGQSCSAIEVLSGAYAWNEDILGAELVPGKGKATPMPATVEERMIRLWANPQGAFKAAFAGTSDPPSMTPRQTECKIAQDNFWVDYEWISPSRFGVFGRPIYKPEFWDKVQELDQ